MRDRERRRKLQPLLQAPHFCQRWHLYLLNPLLIPCHICCCKLLLRPTLDNEGKGTVMGARVSWVLFFFFIGAEKRGRGSGFVVGLLLKSPSLVFFPALSFPPFISVYVTFPFLMYCFVAFFFDFFYSTFSCFSLRFLCNSPLLFCYPNQSFISCHISLHARRGLPTLSQFFFHSKRQSFLQ